MSEEVNYEAVLVGLEARFVAGQAQYDAWPPERDELLGAMDAIQKLLKLGVLRAADSGGGDQP